MQLIIKNGFVIATHTDIQDVTNLYPDCEVVSFKRMFRLNEEGRTPDPRTDEEKREVYKDRRRQAYPPIVDQLDMIFWDKVNGTNKWVEMITEIKNRIRP